MATAPDDLDTALRRTDPDRWLSSRLIGDPDRRADVTALYAFDQELAQVVRAAREPLMAEIRLTWWREALEELFAGKTPRGHPVLSALATTISRRRLTSAPLEAMIEARVAALEPEAWADPAGLEAHIDATDGAVMALAVAVLTGADALAIRPAAQAWGLTRLARTLRDGPDDRLPPDWDPAAVAVRARAALVEARPVAAGLAVAAFPAVAHLALAPCYLAGRQPLGIEKRFRITWAALSGRI